MLANSDLQRPWRPSAWGAYLSRLPPVDDKRSLNEIKCTIRNPSFHILLLSPMIQKCVKRVISNYNDDKMCASLVLRGRTLNHISTPKTKPVSLEVKFLIS